MVLLLALLGVVYVSSFPLTGKGNIDSPISSILNPPYQPSITSGIQARGLITNIRTTSEHITPTPSLPLHVLPSLTPTFITATPDQFANIYHNVVQSETIDLIAARYGVTPEQVRDNNWMHGNAILPGQKLLIIRGTDWQPQRKRYAVLKAQSPIELAPAYPLFIERDNFRLHYAPNNYPAVDPESIAILFENGISNNEEIFHRKFDQHFDLFVAGQFYESPNQYLRGHSFGKYSYISFLHDGSGDAVDQQYYAAHEMTHYYMWKTFGQPFSFLLSEGTAVYAGRLMIDPSEYIPLETFCQAYELSGILPDITNIDLSFKGHYFDLENYYSAGCFVKYLIEKYGVEKLGQVYPTNDYEKVYGRSLYDLVKEWQNYLHNRPESIPFDLLELINLNRDLKSAYSRYFLEFYTSPEMVKPYMALDQARLATLRMQFVEARILLDQFYIYLN